MQGLRVVRIVEEQRLRVARSQRGTVEAGRSVNCGSGRVAFAGHVYDGGASPALPRSPIEARLASIARRASSRFRAAKLCAFDRRRYTGTAIH